MTEDQEKPTAGLCTCCRLGTRVTNRRGSVFILCAQSASDPSYSKYPRLPVVACDAFTAATERSPESDVPDSP